jgi:hypothetical protein
VSADVVMKHNIIKGALTYGDEAGVVPNGIEEALKLKKVNTGLGFIVIVEFLKFFDIFSKKSNNKPRLLLI